MRVTTTSRRATLRRLRRLDLALVAGVAALYLIWVSRGDLTRVMPGGQAAALALASALVGGLVVGRMALTGALARLWARLRAEPAPLILALLLLLAAATRWPGLPVPVLDPSRYAPLEEQSLAEARRILTTGDYRPETFARPSLLLYLQTAAGAAAFLVGVSEDRWRDLYFVQPADLAAPARFLNALLGVATVALVYATGRRLYGPRAGLFAAALLALSPLAWLAARTATEDALAAFVGLVAFQLGARSAERGTAGGAGVGVRLPSTPVPRSEFRAPSLVGALLLGGASGVRPSLVLLIVPFLLGLLLGGGARPTARDGALLALVALAGYLLAVPYAVAELPRLLDTGAAAAREYHLRAEPATVAHATRQLPPAIGLLAREETLLGLVGGLGALLALARRRLADLLLLGLLVPSGLLLLLRHNLDARHLVPYGPYLALLGGMVLDSAWTLLAARHRRTRSAERGARNRA